MNDNKKFEELIKNLNCPDIYTEDGWLVSETEYYFRYATFTYELNFILLNNLLKIKGYDQISNL